MPCYKLGCKCEDRDLCGEKSIAFRTKENTLIRLMVQWCQTHSLESIEYLWTESKNEEIIKAYGY